jgi:hypothetical protein
MSTRATYTLTENAMNEEVITNFYIQTDGDSEGAATTFYNMLTYFDHGYSSLMMDFVRANDKAQLMASADSIGGLEFQYFLNNKGDLIQLEIDPVNDELKATDNFKVWDFVNNNLTYSFREYDKSNLKNRIPKSIDCYPLTWFEHQDKSVGIITTKHAFDYGLKMVELIKENPENIFANKTRLKDAARYFGLVKSCYDELSEQNNKKPFISLYSEASTMEQIVSLLQEVNDKLAGNQEGRGDELLIGFKHLLDQVVIDEVKPVEIEIQETSAVSIIDDEIPADQDIVKVSINEEKQGIEIKFIDKPNDIVRAKLRKFGFKWHAKKLIWWARNSDERLEVANSF